MHLVPIPNEGYPGLNPLILGWRQCTPGLQKGPVVHPYWLLHYVTSGAGRFCIRDKVYTVTGGMMFVIPPYVPCSYEADQADPWNYTWVGFSYPTELPVKLEDVMECPGALQYFNAMRICEKRTAGRSAFLCAQLWELFSHLAKKEHQKSDFVDEAIAIIHTEYAGNLTTTVLAERLNMDRSYFSTRFKKRVGVSPGKYLIDMRMRIAANLLAGGAGVGVTAVSVGYADIYVFSKMFKRFYGMSPSQYIKTIT